MGIHRCHAAAKHRAQHVAIARRVISLLPVDIQARVGSTGRLDHVSRIKKSRDCCASEGENDIQVIVIYRFWVVDKAKVLRISL
jgi:hypothetical protein